MDWFRLYAEFATDPKVQMMSEALQRRLIMLFCLQCSNGIETFHETEREAAIAFALRVSEDDLAETKDVFLRRGFINEDWTLSNWDKRQYVSDSSTERVRKHRQAKKEAQETSETLPQRSSNASEQIQNRTDTEQKERVEACPPAAQSSPTPKATRATRLPGDWDLPQEWADWALSEQPSWTRDGVQRVAASFRDYWTAKAGADARKADWQATWRNWVRREKTPGLTAMPAMNRQEALEARNREVAERFARRIG